MEKNDKTEKKRELNKGLIITIIILGLSFGFFIGRSWGTSKKVAVDTNEPTSEEATTEETVNDNLASPSGVDLDTMFTTSKNEQKAFVAVSSQSYGGKVAIDQVTLPKAGWVAVRESQNGEMGNILGALWLPEGSATNIMVELLRGTVSGQKYFATLYNDDGDKNFSTKSDTLILNASGKPFMEVFTVN